MDHSTSGAQQIEIGKILQQKAKRSIPGWAIRLVEKLIHQREINEILLRYSHLDGVEFMNALVEHFRLSLQVIHPENLPTQSRAMFVANHPLGGLDGICISHLLGQHYQNSIQYIVNDLLYFLKPLQSIFVPVNKYGAQAKKSLLLLQRALESDLPVVSFPAGLCSRKINGKIQDSEWKTSFVKQAIQYHRDIVPMFFVGRNSNHFYEIERLRKKLGIQFNIGTALLPDEMFRAQGKSFQLIVGKPISVETLVSLSAQEIRQKTLEIRQQVYNLHY